MGINKRITGLSIHMLCIILIIVMGQALNEKKVFAASGVVELTMEEDAVSVSDVFIVTVTVSSEDLISGVEMLLTYDEDYLEFLTGSPTVTGEEGTLKIYDIDMQTPKKTCKYLLKFEAKKRGDSYIRVAQNAAVYNENSSQTMSIASNVLCVECKSSTQESSDNELSSLKISGGTLEPEFSKDVTEYNVMIGSDVDQLIISANPSSTNATVKIKGNDSLHFGDNVIKVIVSAQNGNTKEYVIYAKKETPEEESTITDSNNDEENAQTEHEDIQVVLPDKISVAKVGSEIFITTYGEYEIIEVPEKAEIPDGYMKATLLVDGCAIPVYESSENGSDFVLVYGRKDGTKAQFYQYDKKDETLQRYDGDNHGNDAAIASSEAVLQISRQYESEKRVLSIIIAILFGINLTGILVFVRMYTKQRNRD